LYFSVGVNFNTKEFYFPNIRQQNFRTLNLNLENLRLKKCTGDFFRTYYIHTTTERSSGILVVQPSLHLLYGSSVSWLPRPRFLLLSQTVTVQSPLHAATAIRFPLVDNDIIYSLRCTKAQHKYLRDHHLLFYEDLVARGDNSWRWQLPDLPAHLQAVVWLLILPVGESVPLLPG